MHYKKLLKAHEVYSEGYPFEEPYDSIIRLMKDKRRVTREDVREILSFLNKWQCRIPKTTWTKRLLREYFNNLILPRFSRLSKAKIENLNFDKKVIADSHRTKISWLIHNTYDELFQIGNKISNTAISKMLHIVCPGLFVMWDVEIRKHYAGYNNTCGYEFAFQYLPEMKEEILQAIETYRKDHGGSADKAARSLSALCHRRTLAKLADEFNYLKYTAKQRF